MDSTAWDNRYAASELVWSAGPNLFLPPLVEGLVPGSAIDIACGEGRNAIWLARSGWDVVGVDFSPGGIDKAKRLAGDVEVDWVVADATSYQPGRPFDLVLVFYLHLMPDELADALAHACDAVAPGGQIFGVGHGVRNLTDGVGGPPFPQILWSESLIEPMLDGLTVVELGERLRPVEGSDVDAIDLVFNATRG